MQPELTVASKLRMLILKAYQLSPKARQQLGSCALMAML
jgi:hypothetical protein